MCVCASGQLVMPKPSAKSVALANTYTFFFFFYRHVFEERLEGKGLSHGELILNEACLPAKYAKHHSVKRLGKQWWEQVVLQGPRRT